MPDLAAAQQFLMTRGLDFGLNLLAAIALWFVGRWAIRIGTRLLGNVVRRSGKVDPTLADYLSSVVSVLLTILLILAILQLFGVQTTSFAALLAGLGLAIGTAWGGLLAHFAAGVFMQVLRPFKVGDVISAGGVTGTVKELGLFGTTIVTADNIVTIVGNNKIFSDNIANYSATPHRRVDLTAKIANTVDAGRCDRAPEGTDRADPERARRSGAGRRRAAVHAGRPAAVRASVDAAGELLAGVLRHQPRDSRDVPRSAISDARNAGRASNPVTASTIRRTKKAWPRPRFFRVRRTERGAQRPPDFCVASACRPRTSFHSAPSATGTTAAPMPTSTITFRYCRMNGMLPKK